MVSDTLYRRVYQTINSGSAVHLLNVKKSMILACQNNHREIVKFLVNSGFDLNQTIIGKKTPLYTACEYGHVELATYLIHRFETDVNV